MIDRIRRFFLGEMQSLHLASANTLDVFTKTVNKLTSLNERIDKSVTTKENQIAKLEQDKNALTKLKISHGSVITRLNSIIND